MRALWIALLIALLPLRGWVGDAMALSMLAAPGGHPVQQAGAAGPCPHAEPAAAHAGAAHVESANADHRHVQGDAAPDNNAGHQHLACDLCNGPALQASATDSPRGQASPGPQVLRAERFASLAPRQQHKPPIA